MPVCWCEHPICPQCFHVHDDPEIRLPLAREEWMCDRCDEEFSVTPCDDAQGGYRTELLEE